MVIGILQIELDIPGAQCLKDKRRIVRSLKDTCHKHHMVSIAEVDALDVWNRAVLGISATSNAGIKAAQSLDKVTDRIRSQHGCEIISTTREIIPFHAVIGSSDQPDPEQHQRDNEDLAQELLDHAGNPDHEPQDSDREPNHS